MTEHISRETMQLLVDKELPAAEARRALQHLRECPSCATVHATLASFDRTMRRMPVPSTGPQFTRDVLSRLGIPQHVSYLHRAFRNVVLLAGGVFALLVTATIGGLVALADWDAQSPMNLPRFDAVNPVWTWFEGHIGAAGTWLLNIAGQLAGGKEIKTAVALLLMMTAFAAINWFMQRKGSANGL